MEEDPAALLLSDELMEEDDESEIYEIEDVEDDENDDDFDVVIAATSDPRQSDDMDASFFLDEDEDTSDLVEENPFEPVYPAAAAGLLFENDIPIDSSNASLAKEKSPSGIVLEAVSLDNILPAGSRRRRN